MVLMYCLFTHNTQINKPKKNKKNIPKEMSG